MLIQNQKSPDSTDILHISPETQRNFHSNSTKITNNPLVFKPAKNFRRSVDPEARNHANDNLINGKNLSELIDLKVFLITR